MKVLKQIEIDNNEGLLALIGQRVTFICAGYIYVGDLVGVNETCVKLKDAAIVYETGPWNDGKWKDAQKFPGEFFYLQTGMIEGFGVTK